MKATKAHRSTDHTVTRETSAKMTGFTQLFPSFLPRISSTPRWAVLGAALLGLLIPATNAASAQAASPWWHLTSGARPTYIQPGSATDASYELTVKATGGTYTLVYGPDSASQTTAPISFNAPAASVQAALEALPAIGPGNIDVTGGPGAAAPLIITATGALSDRVLPRLFGDGTKLTGAGHQANLTVLDRGSSDGEIYLTAVNVGDAPADGKTEPLRVADTLPPGLEALEVAAFGPSVPPTINTSTPLPCDLATLTCESSGSLAPFAQIEVRIAVRAKPGAEAQSGEPNQVTVSGGGGPAAHLSRPVTISAEPTPFGVEEYELRSEEEGGGPAASAATHPFQQTTAITINQLRDPEPLQAAFHQDHVGNSTIPTAGLAKDMSFRWPPGLVANPTTIPTCTMAQFSSTLPGHEGDNACPEASAVGVAVVTETNTAFTTGNLAVPLFNVETAYGEPARVGFFIPIVRIPVLIDPAVRSADGEDYGITLSSTNITQLADLVSVKVTVWGAPGDPRHDISRGWGCLAESRAAAETGDSCGHPNAFHPPAFLTLPTQCTASLSSGAYGDPWSQPVAFPDLPLLATTQLGSFGACNRVPFDPKIHATPSSNAATSPTGLEFDLGFENEGLLSSNPGVSAESAVKKAVVTLPQGFTTNPSVAEGLKACTEAQFHAEGIATLPGEGCPNESKIGDVTVESPLIGTKQVNGSLYVAKQGENPNHNLLTIYLVVRNPELGLLVKQALKVIPDPVTGQLTTEVDNIPQLPFSHFHLSFRQGQRSPLITPPACGTYTVAADLYPYSEPNTPVHRESSFQITQGAEGLPCPSGGVPSFKPNLEAGTVNNAAGTYSPFVTKITRKDSEQEITHFSIKLPPGVIGKLAGVSSCSDAAIAAAKAREHEGGGQEELNSPSCPANSEVGHSLVGSGVGNVLAYAPGKLYLAGPYHGSNISLVSITAAKVGPFDLGTVVVRFALKIDPETAEVFVDGQGSDPIPHIVDGIPIHLRDIRVYISRHELTLNPTSCEPLALQST
ncbi:MAG TPA: hypothetical protein VGO13_03880, partial [Solirubrobacterales bacterium]|nr:hypothetical protein [Solirubrobacterales bacterium]